MNAELTEALLKHETDLEGVKTRFSGNDDLYITCLKAFLEDTTILELEEAYIDRRWDDAFTAAHALKGLAGNMGFIPLFHSAAELVVVIRAGRVKELSPAFVKTKRCYDEITEVIRRYGIFLEEGIEGGTE